MNMISSKKRIHISIPNKFYNIKERFYKYIISYTGVKHLASH
nr:MAG TPA: hypothetical protein [Caudoviricetes sp.]